MNDNEAIQMMKRCADEIRTMRKTIDRLQPKAEAYDCMKELISMAKPQQGGGYGEDLAWTLENRVKELIDAQARDQAKKELDAALDRARLPEAAQAAHV